MDTNTVLALDPGVELTVTVVELDADTVGKDLASLAAIDEILLEDLGKTPETGGVDLLATGNLVLGATKGLESVLGNILATTDGTEDLTDLDAGDGTVGLTPGTTHTSLEPIGTSAGKHLVDANNVERVDTDADVESILTGGLGHVLVASNTTSLKGLRGDLIKEGRQSASRLERPYVAGLRGGS